MKLSKCTFCNHIGYTPYHVTEINNGKAETFYMCKVCGMEYMKATSQNIKSNHKKTSSPSLDLSEIKTPEQLVNLIQNINKIFPLHGKPPCKCGLTFNAIRKQGRMGCPECYTHFADEIEPFLKSQHGATEHIGKRPTTMRREVVVEEKLLKLQLAQAIEFEQYEKAAEIKKRLDAIP